MIQRIGLHSGDQLRRRLQAVCGTGKLGRARAAGAVTQEPFFRPYGWHMFRMKDPAGNHINIYTVPQPTL